MAFRYIRGAAAIESGGCVKPRLLLVESQRLFANHLSRVLATAFEVVTAENGVFEPPHDVVLIDTDAASLNRVEDIVRLNNGGAPICLLSMTAAPRVHSGGAQVHVLSKTMGEFEFLAAVKRIAHGGSSTLRVMRRVPQSPAVRFSSTYGFVLPEFGGDWYDVFETHGRIAFAIGDVAGHGVQAARSMNLLRHAMVRLALANADPAEILSTANKLTLATDALYATALCGYIEPHSRQIVYATAGHPPPVLALRKDAVFLETGGVMLGASSEAAYRTVCLQLPDNALLVLYTDGVTERDGDLLDGERRLLAAVRDAAVRGVTDAARAIQDAMFVEKAPVDDVAILAVAFGPLARLP